MTVLLQEDRGAVRVLTLNRPRRRNALDTELLRALEDRFAAAEADDGVDVIVLTGTDPAFCGGVDLRELEERGRPPEMGAPLAGVTKPVIGAINGPAITGGLELALMCDLLIASELAVFADTHGRLGLLPGWGQMARLPHAVGTRRATELLLTSRTCAAAEALELGLVNAVVPHADTLERALGLAAAIGESDQPAVRAILAQLREGAGDRMATALARERERADRWQGQGFDTDRVSRQRDSLK
jgi:enoyl-CoA hydratase